MSTQPEGIAKLIWEDPNTGERRELVLVEGATASIGRSDNNDVPIPQKHVSRQHAVIAFRDGVFTITDLGSANGTFVNDQQVTEPYPLAHGDVIRLYVPIIHFSAFVTEEEQETARKTGAIKVPAGDEGHARVQITAGAQEGAEFLFNQEAITVGRLTQDMNWDIALADRAVSRPHCRFIKKPEGWTIMDLGSANGTLLNNEAVGGDAMPLKDGDVLLIGETRLLFRVLDSPEPSAPTPLPQTGRLS